MSAPHYSINAVAQRTGLSPHVLRVWEKRYRAVEPERTATNRRLYSDEQVERFGLLREATKAGHSIGAIAKLPADMLRQMATAEATPKARAAAPEDVAAVLVDQALEAVRLLDAGGLEQALKRADVALGTQGMLQRVAAPLAHAFGSLWREGTITAGHEHFASAVLRTHLSRVARPFAASGREPVIIVATPQGQLHELGALLAAAAAANVGWQALYLGASLPAPEIAGAAHQRRARAVALSLVYPDNDPLLEAELLRLRELLPAETKIIVGGRATAAYAEAIGKIGAAPAGNLSQLLSLLDAVR